MYNLHANTTHIKKLRMLRKGEEFDQDEWNQRYQ